ncbi:tumor necrosis factor alpha-induced protein 8-like protein 1 isoform 1-T1 [Morphnus guianensis]
MAERLAAPLARVPRASGARCTMRCPAKAMPVFPTASHSRSHAGRDFCHPCQEMSFSSGEVFTQWLPLWPHPARHTRAGPGGSRCCLHPWQRARDGYCKRRCASFLLLLLCHPNAEMDTFSTKNLALQAQKKLLSKMATKTIANVFIDDTSSEILDELYRATKEYTHNRKEAQKIIKNLIKIVMKLGMLYRNGQFNPEELVVMERFRKKVHTLAMTAVSFHQIDFTFDRRVMSGVLTECRDLLHEAVNGHLTAKSHSRINHVFNHFADYEFLSALYGPSEPYRTHLKRICEGVNKMLEEDNI